VPAVKVKKMDARQAVIRRIIEGERDVPSTREMAVLLERDHGIDVTNMTVQRDYADLGITQRKRIKQRTLLD
jgi:arginine repressor